MRVLLAVAFLGLLFCAAPDAQAWCVMCDGHTCWMTWDNGATRCSNVGSYGCATMGSCAGGTVGCPDPLGCGDPEPTGRRDCAPAPLESEWRLASVEIKHTPRRSTAPSVAPARVAVLADARGR